MSQSPWLSFNVAEQRGGSFWYSVQNFLGSDASTLQFGPAATNIIVARSIILGSFKIQNKSIDGIEIQIGRAKAGPSMHISDYTAQLLWRDTPTGDNKADSADWNYPNDVIKTYGGPKDLWGLGSGINPTDLSRSDFGFTLSVYNYNAEWGIGYAGTVQIKIYYKSMFFVV